MSAHGSRLALSSPLFPCRPFRWQETGSERRWNCAKKREGKSMGQGQTEGERGRERREAGRGKGAGRDEDGGTERQRELGETAREPLQRLSSAQRRSAVSGSAEQHFVERRCTRRIEVPMAAERVSPPWPRSPRRARRNPRRLRRGRQRAGEDCRFCASPSQAN